MKFKGTIGMSLKSVPEKVEKLLKKHGQTQILTFWDRLDTKQKEHLLFQIEQLDFTKIDEWIRKYVKNQISTHVPAEFGPAQSYKPKADNSQMQSKYEKAVNLGKNLIASGKVAAFVVAGGQGTRLGFDGPKGGFAISPIKKKTLFQLFAESILAVSKKYGCKCPWYIMTSELNYAQTVDIMRSNNYYGLDSKDVFIFQQGTLPNFDVNGKILMASKDTIACSPDGHGGSLKALYASGAIKDMQKRGVQYISYFQVDNTLISIFDPLFIGLHALDDAEMSSKALTKTGPLERVGNFCSVDGKVNVIEYSDLPEEMAKKINPDGSLVFNLGSIAIHIINVDFVEKLNAKGFSLPLHRAIKKVPFIDLATGKEVSPDKPNGVKLESFVFDALPLATKSIILETLRSEEFGPVKNATGVDSAETSHIMMIERAASWLEAAGVKVPRKADGSVDAVIEIAPSFAVEKSDIKEKLHLIPQINPGDTIYLV
jgi:UDP-N-acetylglucosamine/UDP-N-acetylgalactosamine diphosphorylase